MTDTELERARLALDQERIKLDHYRVEMERYRPGFEATIRFADIAIRSLLILNGGAALALLTFAGNAASRGQQISFEWSLLAFGIGAAFSVATAGFSYLSQSLYTEGEAGTPYARLGLSMRLVAFAIGFVAWLLFLVGIGLAVCSFAGPPRELTQVPAAADPSAVRASTDPAPTRSCTKL